MIPAFADFLSGLDAWDIVAIAAGSWIVVACLIAVPIGRAMNRADELDAAEQLPSYPPPVPPARPRGEWHYGEADIDWLAAQPADIASVDELDRRFFAIVDRETRWFA